MTSTHSIFKDIKSLIDWEIKELFYNIEKVIKVHIKTADLECLFKGRLSPDLLICTDSHKSYIAFCKVNIAEHIRIISDEHNNVVYHISHVNSLHNKFKKWVAQFDGGLTKYH